MDIRARKERVNVTDYRAGLWGTWYKRPYGDVPPHMGSNMNDPCKTQNLV